MFTKSLKAVLAVFLMVAVRETQAQTGYQKFQVFGKATVDYIYGSCLALQFDMTDETEMCAIDCDSAMETLYNVFLLESYTDYVWNYAEASDRMSVLSVKTIQQFTSCNYLNFLQQLNNRFSDWSFFGGWLTNIATQVTIDLINGTRTSAVMLSWDAMVIAFNDGDYESCGKEMMLFMVSTIDFQAPAYREEPETI